MCTINATEFRNNFRKYVDLAEMEEVKVTRRGKLIFTIVPAKCERIEKAKSFFNMLPKDATIGIDLNERD
jgi:prevent-host-death family protein